MLASLGSTVMDWSCCESHINVGSCPRSQYNWALIFAMLKIKTSGCYLPCGWEVEVHVLSEWACRAVVRTWPQSRSWMFGVRILGGLWRREAGKDLPEWVVWCLTSADTEAGTHKKTWCYLYLVAPCSHSPLPQQAASCVVRAKTF